MVSEPAVLKVDDILGGEGGEDGGAIGDDASPSLEDEKKLEWYAVADEYWKEYLNDLARKAVIEKMVREEMELLLLLFALLWLLVLL